MKEVIPHSGYPCSVREGKIIEYNGIKVDTIVDPIFEEHKNFCDLIPPENREEHRKRMEDWLNGMKEWPNKFIKPHKPKN